MATFTAVVIAHADRENLVRVLGSLEKQTRKADETIALCSDIDIDGLQENFPSVKFHIEPDRSDWGHEKRAKGLDLATSEYIAWFNHDDTYHKTFIERMMVPADAGASVVYCGWSKNAYPFFGKYQCTSGNFIANVRYARTAGYHDRHYEADATFIDELAKLGGKIDFVSEVLYHHNIISDLGGQ